MGRTPKDKIITFFMTKEDIKHKKKKDLSSDEESEDEEANPKAVVQKIVGNDTKIATPSNSIVSKMFTCEDADILVIKDDKGLYWYKAKDICDLLEYVNSRDALKKHVDKEYKKSYADMGVAICDTLKIDSQTIFIEDSGVWQLVTRSKKKEARLLWQKITREILPTLFATGTYTMPATETDIERLKKSFYDDHFISNYKDKLAIYLAYIGEYKGKHILKFGKTNDFVKRDLEQHRKMYKIFNVIKIWETLANDLVEKNIKSNFASVGMLTALTKKELKINCKEKTKRELVVINEVHGLDYCIKMIDIVVTKTVLPQENKYHAEIEKKDHTIELQAQRIKHLEEMNIQLNENIKDLRHRHRHK